MCSPNFFNNVNFLLLFCGVFFANYQMMSLAHAPADYATGGYPLQKPEGNKQFSNNLSINDTQMRQTRSVFLYSFSKSLEKYTLKSEEKPAVNNSHLPSRPRIFKSKTISLTLDPASYMCVDKTSKNCMNKTRMFRDRIYNELKKSLEEIVNEPNYYNVDFKRKPNLAVDETPLACKLLEADVRILRRRDPPFVQHPIGKIFPKRKLFKGMQNVQNCVIVSSAGSMAGSKLGKFIDLHDIVMRFNASPLAGYEEDVGSKTTIRVVNSQVVTKPHFNFVNAPIFQNITIAAWDPGKYNGSLTDWLDNADFDLFANYEHYRAKHPKSNSYLIDPRTIWRLWEILQETTEFPIRRNPPSSGFIGLALLLPHCPYVDFIEYVPSTRLSGKCHYYSQETNAACTFGAWHPLAAEKLMALKLNTADDFAVFQNGIIRIRNPKNSVCDLTGF